ncbi:MAG: helix-turn-helix transcriptional regulator [Anaerolineales bacterium]|nr:helix-turn-helix transcriptional regulator [Anaerolineales bacterium]
MEQSLLEPLTNRELDVLALLGQRLSDKEIAAILVVSLSTVKKHTAHLYAKLQVSDRREAVEQNASAAPYARQDLSIQPDESFLSLGGLPGRQRANYPPIWAVYSPLWRGKSSVNKTR